MRCGIPGDREDLSLTVKHCEIEVRGGPFGSDLGVLGEKCYEVVVAQLVNQGHSRLTQSGAFDKEVEHCLSRTSAGTRQGLEAWNVPVVKILPEANELSPARE
jgi:hypothetical protein